MVMSEDRRRGRHLARNDQKILAIGAIRPFDDLETRQLDHAGECAGGEMEEMLVDEPFLDHIIGPEKLCARRIDHQKPVAFQRAPVVGKHARRIGQMLDGVAGMHNVEAIGLKGCRFNARMNQFGAFEARAGIHHALIRLHGHKVGFGGCVQDGARKTAAIGTDIENRNFAG